MPVLVLLWVEYSELQLFFFPSFFYLKRRQRWERRKDGGGRGKSVNLIPDDLKEVRIISYSSGWADHYQSQICWLHGKDL